MIFDFALPERGPLRRAIADAYRADETETVEALLDYVALDPDAERRIGERTEQLVRTVRAKPSEGAVEAFMQEYALSSKEGIVLMCLAEALLRVPDADTVDRLIEDKLTAADWSRHLGHSESLFVNASTWGFMLTGNLLASKGSDEHDLRTVLSGLLARTGEPIIRQAITQAMRILGRQFIMGETIEEGLRRARPDEKLGYRHSYDMLGEAARTEDDARHFFESYQHAIAAIAKTKPRDPITAPGLSVKLSALDPRYEFGQYERVMAVVLPRLATLCAQAKDARIGLTVDAEEADRLELSFDILARLAADPALAGWDGLGLALQAYQKRAFPAVDWLADLARRGGRRFMVRLVKGAYWDTEIKNAQENGHDGYPVFTRKASTDLAYIACAKKILANKDAFYPQFATHNAQTVSVILELAGNDRDFEFQRLHGMGEALYEDIVAADGLGLSCRVYAPCGGHKELLPYLVRRLLENGANTSFVNRIMDEDVPIEQIAADPVREAANTEPKPHPRIPLPRHIYSGGRLNSRGLDVTDEPRLETLGAAMAAYAQGSWRAAPIVDGDPRDGGGDPVHDPADRRRVVGEAREASADDVEAALASAARAADSWSARPADERATCLERAADLMEERTAQLMAVATREAGKTLLDGIAEVREAVDFCRYYAMQARRLYGEPLALAGGGTARRRAHGVFLCISPWNFPLAIFTGQVTAALAAGNAVIAKPAEQTPIMAAHAVEILHEAGIPGEVLHLLPGRGETVGAALVADRRVAGVAFTGGTDTAMAIRRGLAARDDGPIPFIAETGGQNAMIVDSTALPEQAVNDVIRSAFGSAGQRCSALRVLFVQRDIGKTVIDMLAGAMDVLSVGDPAHVSTDIGPLIDGDALDMLDGHDQRMAAAARCLGTAPLRAGTEHGMFFAPRAYAIESIERLEKEVFGPFLHVVEYDAGRLDEVIGSINGSGYGLTFGLHSRIDSAAEEMRERIHAGNIYVNRNIIGAVVGVQPFGGQGLSGTGPKAGGPHYLARFGRLEREKPTPKRTNGAGAPASHWTSMPIIAGRPASGPVVTTHRPGQAGRVNGTLVPARREHVEQALASASFAFPRWDGRSADARADVLDEFAHRLSNDPGSLTEAAIEAAGLDPAMAAELAEQSAASVRGFAGAGRELLGAPRTLRGYTGERDELSLHGRGVFLCLVEGAADLVSLNGMVAAALAAGNSVLVLCDEAYAHAGCRAVRRWHEAGIMAEALHFIPVVDEDLRAGAIGDPRVAGIAMSGPESAIRAVDRSIARRAGPIIPLIAGCTDGGVDPGFAATGDLYRFAHERSLSVDTTASGGNASLFSMDEPE